MLAQAGGEGREYYLTDAFQYMVDQGRRLLAANVGGWYDCGKVDTLLETNDHLLRNGRSLVPTPQPGVVLRGPIRIEPGVTLRDCTVGPNVTVETGSVIEGSTVEHSILGRNVRVQGSTIARSVIGDDQTLKGQTLKDSVMDGGEVATAR